MVRLLPALAPVEVVAGRLAFALAAAAPALAVPRARAEVWQATRGAAAWTLAALMGSYYLLAVIAFRLAPVADVALLLATAPLCALVTAAPRSRRSPSAHSGDVASSSATSATGARRKAITASR